MHPGLAERLYADALVLDAQRQPAENIFELPRDLRFSRARIRRSCNRLDVVSHLQLRRIDHHGNPVSALVTHLPVDRLLQHSRKESLFQVARIEDSPAHHNPVVLKLREDEEGSRHERIAIGAFCWISGESDGPGLLVERLHVRLAFHTEPLERFGYAVMLCVEVLVAHLLRLRTEYDAFFVAEEHVRQPWTL